MKRAMSATSVATFVWFSRKRITSGSRPVRLRRPGSQYGLGSARASNTKSASPGMPRLKPKDTKLIDSRPALRCSIRLWMMSRNACTEMREVSIRRSATEATGSRSARSMLIASRSPTSLRLMGCLRRVSAKRRSSSSSVAIRKITSHCSPLRLSSSTSSGTLATSAAVLRASSPTAVRS